MPFTPTTFVNNQQPPLSAAQMNKLGTQHAQAVADVTEQVASGTGSIGTGIDARTQKMNRTATPLTAFYDVSNPPTNYTAAFLAGIAAGVDLWVPAGDYPVAAVANNIALNIVDQSVSIKGPGRIIQPENTQVLQVTATPTGPWPIQTEPPLVLWRNKARQSDDDTDVSISEMVRTLVPTNPNDIAQFAATDKLFVNSNQRYAANYGGTTAGTGVYKGGWADIIGVGVKLTGASEDAAVIQFPIRSTVTGAASGATGVVAAVTVDYTGGVWLIFDKISKAFDLSEGILVNGVSVAGATPVNRGVLISARLMDDTTYDGTLQVYKANKNVKVDIDIRIDTATDPDGSVGKDQRKISVSMTGIIDVNAKIHTDRTYRTATEWSGCYGGNVTVTGGNSPNITAIEAFGYSVLFRSACEMMNVYVDVTRVRHGFTTTSQSLTTAPTGITSILRAVGTAKHCTVSGRVKDSIAGAFDTHAGPWKIHFTNCEAIATHPAGKDDAVPVGFQNRAFGTIYTNCTAVDCEIGFIDHTFRWAPERNNTIIHKNSSALGYRRLGFFHGTTTAVGSTALGETSYLLDGCLMVAQANGGSAFTGYDQISYCLGMASTSLIRPVSRGATHADIQIRDTIPQLSIIQPFFDHQLTSTSAVGVETGYIIDAMAGMTASRRLAMDSLTLVDNITGDARKSLFHVRPGVTLRIRRPAAALGLFQMIRPSGAGPVLSDGSGTLDSANNATL